MKDAKEQISAVRRQVGDRVLEAGEARVSTISQVYDTGIDDLWDAVTSAERIPRWFMPISGELREYGPGAVGVGWDGAMLGLAMHLADPAAPMDTEAVAAWAASDDGKLFYRLSSDSWAEAAIANGTDPAAARERADRTYAFYTGT
jgi:hypothetical protein